MAASAQSGEQATLAKGAIGLAGQLFQSITHMAPAAGLIFSAQYMASKGGGALPLAWLLATIACALTAICLVEVVRKVRSAGGYFVIHSVALGHLVGFTTSWLWFMFEPVVAGGLSMFLGAVLSDFLLAEFGLLIPWWLIAIVMVAFLTYISYVGIRQSSQATVILGTLEIGILLVFAVLWIARAGSNQPVVSFTPSASPELWGGVFFAMIYAILSFLGFEAGVPLAEESNNARRSLIISILVSCLAIGAFYIVMAYATVAAYGFTDASTFATDFFAASNPFVEMGRNVLGGIGALLIIFVVANSAIACSIAANNASTRVFYSLGRAGVFPKALAHINSKTQTPDRAVFFQGALALAIALFMGFVFESPFLAYGLLGLLWTIALMIVYAMTNLSCFMLYWNRYRDEFNVIKHLIIPILSTILLVLPLIAALAPQILLGFENEYPFTLGLPITIIWTVIGIAFYFYLRAARPESLEKMANEMATVELVGEEYDPKARATASAPAALQTWTEDTPGR
jgi:amino acid transporter